MIYFVLSMLAALLALNAFASTAIARDDNPMIAQKIGQLLLVWIVPVLGVLLVLYFMKGEPARPKRSSPAERSALDDHFMQSIARSDALDRAPSQGTDFGSHASGHH